MVDIVINFLINMSLLGGYPILRQTSHEFQNWIDENPNTDPEFYGNRVCADSGVLRDGDRWSLQDWIPREGAESGAAALWRSTAAGLVV